MNVLCINNHEQIGGGAERVYQGTAQLLMAAGHRVTTLSCGTAAFDPRTQGVLLPPNSYIDKRSPWKSLRNLARYVYWPRGAEAIRDLVVRFKPDVAHLHIFYGQLSSSILPALRQLGVPTVMTVHDYRLLCPVSTLYTPTLGICERCAGGQQRHAVVHRCNRGSTMASALSVLEATVRDLRFDYVEHIDHFLMVSRFCREKHLQHRPVMASRSSVLQNFVTPAREIAAPDPQDRFALFAGRFAPEKGLDLLCDAFADLAAGSGRLELAGDGPLDNALRSRFSGYQSIRFLGRLGSDELGSKMRRAWLSVAPSEWYENNPMSVLESMAQGTPVLGAAIGGIPELIEDGVSGWLFKSSDRASLRDRLQAALRIDRDRRAAMGRAAWQHVRDHNTPEAHLQRLVEVYRQVISRSG
jgi:glycosyltransferase involved in cell wall biosynthesis